jgi:hypothetical protein
MQYSIKWKKLGKIFDPVDFCLPNNCQEFAQSPQVLDLNDRLRIYFSTRATDPKNGKFLSHVAYVDMSRDFKKVWGVSEETVIPLGELGTFDEHGIFPINVFQHDDRILAYTCGWSRRVSVSVETGVGFAESFDKGATFKKLGAGPIMGASLKEPFLVGDAFVKYFNGKFHMWYMFGTKWKTFSKGGAPDRVYKIGHATSEDGVAWSKQEGVQVIQDRLHADESMALPTVEYFGGFYHMYFCFRESADFRHNVGRGYRLGYAYSTDLVSWVRDDELGGAQLSDEGWDSEMQCYPHLTIVDGTPYLLYNGNQFGRSGFGVAELGFKGFDRV